jgi:hypothetical protein
MPGESPEAKLWLLWTGILGGPVAWACDEVIGYVATHHECSTGHRFLFHMLTIGAVLVTGAGFLASWDSFQNQPPSEMATDIAVHRRRFMAKAGMLMSAGFLLVIIATAIPKWILGPCD